MDQLKLSQPLIDAVQEALVSADPRASDPLVAMQYLSAIMGYALAKTNMPAAARRDALEQLNALARHVLEDLEGQQDSRPSAGEAFGIWRPGDP
ncbi:MAG: hypothetical protein ACR2KU_09590 [Gammaproteobacteria bacterium]